MSPFAPIFSRLRDFKQSDDGTATVEFVLWVPLLVFLLGVVVDISIAFTGMGNYWSVSRDTARLVSRHAITETEAVAYAEARAGNLWATPTATVLINGSEVTVDLTTPATSLSLFNTLGFGSTININTSVTHTMEPL